MGVDHEDFDDLPLSDDLDTPRGKFFAQFREQLENKMISEQKEIQKITQMKFQDFTISEYAKSNVMVKIDSEEKFSQKESQQKELILKELTKKLQEKLTFYEKDKDTQNSLLKEEKQKKMIRGELNEIISKNLKDDSNEFLKSLSDKISMNIVPVVDTVNTILENNLVDESKRNDLITIKTNIFEFLDSTSQIAEWQRLIQGDQSIHKTILNINEMINGIIKNQNLIANKKEIQIVFENNGAETIFADVNRISFVLNTLLKNSINLSIANSIIKIITHKSEKGITITLIHSGIGYPAKLLDEVFSTQKRITDPFTKDNELKTGLVISNIIIHNHKGELIIFSHPEKRTEASLTLPAPISFNSKKQ